MFASLDGERILVVAAHPDDEVLGCGGTIARHTKAGGDARALILGHGVTARGEDKVALEALKVSTKAAQAILGYELVHVMDWPDNRYDTVSLLDIVQSIEAAIRVCAPTLILTHHEGDLNIDHQITFRAVVTATRPMAEETVRTILSFETLSATEWNPGGVPFRPTVYLPFDAEALEAKRVALKAYAGEMREYPHPRSLSGLMIQAHRRGMESGLERAEAFMLVRTR